MYATLARENNKKNPLKSQSFTELVALALGQEVWKGFKMVLLKKSTWEPPEYSCLSEGFKGSLKRRETKKKYAYLICKNQFLLETRHCMLDGNKI